MPFVIDASVAMAWCFEDEASEATDTVLDALAHDRAMVPSLWHYEVSNVLVVAERRGRISEAQSARFLDLLARLPVETATEVDPTVLVSASRQHGLTAYDAVYLATAEREGLPVATCDDRLAEACRRAGVPLLVKP